MKRVVLFAASVVMTLAPAANAATFEPKVKEVCARAPTEGWVVNRSAFVAREGHLDFHHYDLYAQALAKIERGHAQDEIDVEAMLSRGLVDRAELRRLFAEIEPVLFRFPAIDARAYRRAVEERTADD